ncbi:Thiolase, C-terminal domain-containing protein [Pisolithus marmoratus]|nr:Thiolase, C-terminal domain-containing protein [Pisolithus marmoratus]
MSVQAAKGLPAILEKHPDDVVITFAKRTAMGKTKKGQFKDIPVDEMMQAMFKACTTPSPLEAAALAAGIPHHVPVVALNRLISLGFAVGVENMTLNPRPTPMISEAVDKNHQARDCIQPMGWTAEMVAQTYCVSREKQDMYALISHTRASQALANGIFSEEILPIEARGSVISVDDTIRPGVTMEGLSALKPVFPDWGEGSTTAGNASGIGDGAAICILTTRERAQREGMDIVGKWVGSTVVGIEPRHMGIGPIVAIPKVLSQLGLSKEDVDVYEINEAFASQFAYCVEELDVPMDKINPNGGAIALSHPLGMTGVRQVVTGLAELRRREEKVLCTSMCVGSGMGAAGIFINEAPPLPLSKL